MAQRSPARLPHISPTTTIVATIIIPAIDTFCTGRGLRATVSVVSLSLGLGLGLSLSLRVRVRVSLRGEPCCSFIFLGVVFWFVVPSGEVLVHVSVPVASRPCGDTLAAGLCGVWGSVS